MTEMIKKYFLAGIIFLLVILLFISRCNKPKPEVQKPIIHIDTIWVEKHGTGTSIPHIVDSVRYNVSVPEPYYVPDSNYPKLLKQYNELLSLYFQKNIMKDTLKLDSVGHVYITDQVYKNKIAFRDFTYDIKYPKVKETIILPAKLRNQVYLGGSLQGNVVHPVSQINAGLMIKNKKDQLFGAYAGLDYNGQMQLGIQGYFKIHLGK